MICTVLFCVYVCLTSANAFSLQKNTNQGVKICPTSTSTSEVIASSGSTCKTTLRSKSQHNMISLTAATAAISNPATKSATQVFLTKLLSAYSNQLIKRPYVTKIISSAIVGGTGDLIIQLVNHRKSTGSLNIFEGVDFRRWLVFTSVAGLYIAPAIHLWFDWLGNLVFPATYNRLTIALIQMALDQTIGALIINVGFFYAFELSNSVFPPWTSDSSKFLITGTNAIKKNIWATMIANWSCWPVINFLNFLVVPLQFRVLVSNLAAVFWNMFLSTIANAKV